MSKTSEAMRRDWAIGDGKRDEGLTTPDDIERFDDIKYGTDDMNMLDVYQQKGTSGKRMPVIINVHGGGWVYGDKNLYQYYAMSLAKRGFRVINFTYRLSPEAKFPAPIEDTCSVVCWMRDNADKYKFDTDNVFMVGDSAGAHILGLFCAVCTDAAYADKLHIAQPTLEKYDSDRTEIFMPRAIGMNCGAYKILSEKIGDKDFMDPDLREDFFTEDGSLAERKLANVTDHVNSSFPPAYIMTAFGDTTAGAAQGDLLTDAYEKNNVEYVRKEYGNDKELLYHVFHVNMREKLGIKCNDEECDFFRAHMWRGKK